MKRNSFGDEETTLISQEDMQNWENAGNGTISRLDFEDRLRPSDHDSHAEIDYGKGCNSIFKKLFASEKHTKLDQWRATAIAGNDITSSCLYVAGICAISAGKYAPISLLIVSVVLYLFRNIYAEVGTALPLNGGTYNVLLNSTTKLVASFAACLTLVSYVATAVVSADSAIQYAIYLWKDLNPMWGTIILLGFFAALTLMGIKDSANVAFVIFAIHILTLLVAIVCFSITAAQDFSVLKQNWDIPTESIASNIFYGFSSALLGVSGFETSSNYLEEQAEGVFPKTLRNMWIAVAFFNPVLSFLSMCILPMDQILDNSAALVAEVALQSNGKWLNTWVCIDAFMVLSGAVLTAYVGITGLIQRMALDRCLPHFLLQENPCRHTNHFIIIGFFVITSSLYVIVDGDVNTLAGVYTIAFLGVMTLFAIGNMLLKYKRSRLYRDVKASWITVMLGAIFVMSGLLGNIMIDLDNLKYFAVYFLTTLLVVMIMFARTRVLKIFLYFVDKTLLRKRLGPFVQNAIHSINEQPMVFFAKTSDPSILNKAILYIRENEITNWLKIVHVYQTEQDIPKDLESTVKLLDRTYPKVRVDLVLVKGEFNPKIVQELSTELKVPKNFMFITCPGNHFPHEFSAFGGIRLITH